MYYLNYFFIFSIFGHFLESIMFKLFDWNLESGFLYGYWTPVYGIGVVLIIFVSKKLFSKLKLNKFLEVIIFIIVITFILTFIEYLGGNILEIVFKKEFWNYSNHKYHFGKYIALDISLIWGVCSIIFLYLIKPWMDKVVSHIPKWLTIFMLALLIVDLVCILIFKIKV